MNARLDDDAELDLALRNALGRKRADPRAFREAVERKVAERASAMRPSADGDAARNDRPLHARMLRRAAGLLPPELAAALIGASVAKSTAGAVGKVAAATLAFPIALLVMIVATFVLSLRSLARTRSEAIAADATLARRWWGRNLLYSLIVLLTVGASTLGLALDVGHGRAIDCLLAILLVSMIAFTLVVRSVARAGRATRTEIATLCSELWMGIGMALLLLRIGEHEQVDVRLPISWLVVPAFGASFACSVVAARSKGTPGGIESLIAFAFGCIFLGTFVTIGVSRPRVLSRLELVQFVEQFDGGLHGSSSWAKLARVAEWLRRDPATPIDLSRARAALSAHAAASSSADPEKAERLSPWIAFYAARLGLIDRATWDDLLARAKWPLENRVLGERHALNVEQDAYLILGLIATDRMPEQARSRLAERLAASRPSRADVNAFRATGIAIAVLDGLGRSDLADALRDDVHRLLASQFVREARLPAGRGGFSPIRPASWSDPTTTAEALTLIERFGAPSGVDVELLRRYLKAAAQRPRLGSTPVEYDVEPAVALAKLESILPEPSRSWTARVLEERLAVAVLLMLALTSYAIWSAAPSPRLAAGEGAK